MPSEMQASRRVCWYPWQPREWHHHTVKETKCRYLPTSTLPKASQKEGKKEGANCHTNTEFGARNSMTSQSEYASSESQPKPTCQIGVHDLQTPLTSVGLILTKSKLNLASYNPREKLPTHTNIHFAFHSCFM